jgi:hypothetical protein
MPTLAGTIRPGLTPPILPPGGAGQALPAAGDSTLPALQRPAGAARPPLAGQATPQRDTVVVLASDEERRALDAVMARRGGPAAVAKDTAKAGTEAGIVKAFELTLSSLSRSVSGALGGIFSTIVDALAQRDTEKQLAQTRQGAENFQARCAQVAQSGPQARAALYGVDSASGAQASEVAQAWLQHQEAGKKSDRINVALGVAGGLNGAAEAGVAIAHELSAKAGKAVAGALHNAIPFVGSAGAVISLATSAHALKKQNAVRTELNTQQYKLAAATRQLQGADQASLGGALANVFQHSQARLEVKATANHLLMAGSALAIAGSGAALAGHVATATGVGVGVGAGLATASVVLSVLSLMTVISAAVYETFKGRHDAGEKAAITPEQLESRFEGLEGKELEAAKAQLAGQNKFYALVYLAEHLQTADAGSDEFLNAQKMLEQAGLSSGQILAITALARTEPGAVDIRSPAVNELAKALYGTAVGEVATEKAETAKKEETAKTSADAPPQTQGSPPADSWGSLQHHGMMMA